MCISYSLTYVSSSNLYGNKKGDEISSPILFEPPIGIAPTSYSFFYPQFSLWEGLYHHPQLYLVGCWTLVVGLLVVLLTHYSLHLPNYSYELSLVLARYCHLHYEVRFHRVHPIFQLPLLIEVAILTNETLYQLSYGGVCFSRERN